MRSASVIVRDTIRQGVHFDLIAIVGAGPAGSFVAKNLALAAHGCGGAGAGRVRCRGTVTAAPGTRAPPRPGNKQSWPERAVLCSAVLALRAPGTPGTGTTASLEALKANSVGRQTSREKGDAAAIPFYKQAMQLDPGFPLVHAAAAVSYNNLGQATQAAENATIAYQLRDRVSQREKYRIEALYYFAVTGELEKSSQIYEM